jgi:hypothetical protein
VAGGLSSSTFSSAEWNSIEGSQTTPFKFWLNQRFPEKNPARIRFCQIPNFESEEVRAQCVGNQGYYSPFRL